MWVFMKSVEGVQCGGVSRASLSLCGCYGGYTSFAVLTKVCARGAGDSITWLMFGARSGVATGPVWGCTQKIAYF